MNAKINTKSKKIFQITEVIGILVSSIVFIFSHFTLQAQNDSPFTKEISIRGKVTSFFVIEDLFWRNANIGLEYRFKQHHSIGLDFVFFRWRKENDSIVQGIEYSSGFNSYSKRNYLILDYRFYFFNAKKNEIDGVHFYINPFLKTGKRNIWSENSTTYWAESSLYQISYQNSNFYDIGIAFGLKKGIWFDNHFGFDTNIGFSKRFSDIKIENGYDFRLNKEIEKVNTQESKWIAHMRLNLYYQFKTK